MQRLGEREDDVEIVDRQQARQAALQPLGALDRLALGTVPVAAGVIGDAAIATAMAGLDMAAQGRRAASGQPAQHGRLLRRDRVSGTIGLPVGADNVRHLQGRAGRRRNHG